MQALVGAGMQVGELGTDHERLGRPVGLLQPQRPGAGHGDAARALDHSGQGEHGGGQTVALHTVGGLLVELGVRVGGGGRRARAWPRRQPPRVDRAFSSHEPTVVRLKKTIARRR